MTHSRNAHSTRLARMAFRVERRIMGWPEDVGLARIVGALGVLAVLVEGVTFPFLDATGPIAARLAIIAAFGVLGVLLLAAPRARLNRATSHAAALGIISLQTANVVCTGAIESPYLAGYVAVILATALFAPRRMVVMTFGCVLASVAVVAVLDPHPSPIDLVRIVTQSTVVWLVGTLTSILGSRQRRTIRRTERRLRHGLGQASSFRREALVDPLTGLGNRRAFERDLAERARHAGPGGLLVVMADADGLKEINDHFGHAVGDAMLQGIAAGLRDKVRTEDRVYRIGGDEFAALISGADVASVASRLGDHLEAEVPEYCHVRASLGIAGGDGRDDLRQLVALADARMYEVKRASRRSRELPARAGIETGLAPVDAA